MIHHGSVIFILLLAMACNTPKPAATKTDSTTSQDCTTLVQAEDFAGLDGCQVLLITPNKKKLLVAENNTGTSIVAGRSYKLGYSVIEDGVSVCMAEDAIISVNCLEAIEIERPVVKECWIKDNAIDIPFLKKIIETTQPLRIVRHEFRGGAAYQISNLGASMLYDCQGGDLCADLEKGYDECIKYLKKDFGKSKIIYQGEGPQD